MTGRRRATQFGPLVGEAGVTFRLWAPSAAGVELLLPDAAPQPMEARPEGWFELEAKGLHPGQRYMFRIGDAAVPDPASRGQAADADGWSLVAAPMPPPVWHRPPQPWNETILAEVHVGTATPEGTFRALIERLDHFRDAGFTAIELMPVADFAGRWNWGYDGVLLFAPDRQYGTLAELRTLVEAAHARDLAVILDVVYNHFGPSGNFLPLYAGAFFRPDVATPWGPAVDLEHPTVRAFFIENALHWLEAADVDGLRFDAVHAFATTGAETFLAELAAACRAAKPDAFLVLENHDNIAGWLVRGERPAYTAQWNDDWHHGLHHLATGEAEGYYAAYVADPHAKAARALAEGFIYQGEPYPDPNGAPRGTPSAALPPDAFISFIQNHDHIGNRPLGERLAGSLPPERLAFLRFVLMLSPQIPMLFMGEEGLIATPFPFFCDFEGELAEAVRRGRRAEFEPFFVRHGGSPDELPDPLAEATFRAAKIPWELFAAEPAAGALAAFRELAARRRELVWPLIATPYVGAARAVVGTAIAVTWRFEAGALTMALNPAEAPAAVEAPGGEPAAHVGALEPTENGELRLGAFAAAVWAEAAEAGAP